MARTKQTAKKSTGGSAPRVSLTYTSNTGNPTLAPFRNDSAIPALDPCDSPLTSTPCGATVVGPRRPEEPSANESATRPCLAALLSSSFGQPESESSCNGNTENNDFCHLCMDGGALWRCDSCIRSECKKCIVVPPEFLTVVEHAGVKYICLSCHLMDDVKSKTVIPYMAFYRDGIPVLPHPPHVHGRFELSTKSFIQAPVTAVLHFRLKTIPPQGPIGMLLDFMQPYFAHSGGLMTKDVPFDLGTEGKRKTYLKNAVGIATKILAMAPSTVIFAVSTHTDDDRGDLFAGLEAGKPMAADIQEFFDVLLSPFGNITRNSRAILYMLSCGRYVRHSDSRGAFTRAIAKFHFSACIAFDARRFHPSVAWAFLVTLTDSVVLQGHSFTDAVPVALGKSIDLNRHSGVYAFLLSPDRKTIQTTRFLWAHCDYRPWGKDVPLQCPGCGAPQEKWKRTTQPGGYRFQCRNPGCLGDKRQRGPYCFDVVRPKRIAILPHGKSSTSFWTSKHLRAVPVDAALHSN